MSNWRDALELQLDTLKFYKGDLGRRYFDGMIMDLAKNKPEPPSGFDMFDVTGVLHSYLCESLYRGDTCYISEDMGQIIEAAARDLPDTYSSDHRRYISRAGFVEWEVPFLIYDLNGRACSVGAFAWITDIPLDKPITVFFMFSDTEDVRDHYYADLHKMDWRGNLPKYLLLHAGVFGDGNMLAPLRREEDGTPVAEAYFFALHEIAQQPYTVQERDRPLRPARRRISREYPEHAERLVTLVTLRRKSIKAPPAEDHPGYSHRFVVRGHWRKQWYPSLKMHQWKYIPEYIKGPEDKPLIIKERRVFNFVR